MEEIITKDTIKKLMEIGGEVRALAIKPDGQFILKEKGPSGLKKVEYQLKEWGYPIEYKKIKEGNFFPVGIKALSLLAIKEVFGFDDAKIREICAFHPKTPLVIKIYMKYFYSISKITEKIQEMWRRYWLVGDLVFVEHNEKENYIILRIKDLNLHPIVCRCFEGYFQSFAELVFGKREITCEETKCFFKGDEFHEYLIKWQ